MIASLPMYDWPEVRRPVAAFWEALSQHLGVSVRLDCRNDHRAVWRDPQLLFSQTCGYPLTHEFRGQLTLVATPHYAADGCEGPDYCSMILARERMQLEAFRGRRAAVNAPDSMSGMLALKLVFAPLARQGRFFRDTIETGSHRQSMQAVRDGRAEVCAIDAVCMALAQRYRPDYLAGLVEIARSPPVPCLPFVTRARDPVVLRRALAGVFADDAVKEARQQLLLTGFSVLENHAYDRITDLESEMERTGGLKVS